jgi:hypothetical protein
MEALSLYSVCFESLDRLLLQMKKKNAVMPMRKARTPSVPPIISATGWVVDVCCVFDESRGLLEDVVSGVAVISTLSYGIVNL